ncbi:MAG: 30S ribosomal protein S12 methylthiotransferase RimO [Clostridiales bacterium]|nr:30S ribosomal protein S12 methylthiotransferase RimO [Clostridiales bacterium]
MNKKIGMISLGCPKNQVDAERMLAQLCDAGYEISENSEELDAVIINTCGFIDAAKEEAIENILEMAQYKQAGLIKKIIVTGCLAQRYSDEILKEIPEVDGVIGIGANADIVSLVNKVLSGETFCKIPAKNELPLSGKRVLSTPEHWAYLKISDGCMNRCAYCAIPGIRGDLRSVKPGDVISEAHELAKSGVKELIIVAQDTTNYGYDLFGKSALPSLLKELCKIDGIKWIRLLYCYPDKITDELLSVMKSEEKILHYIDLPLQHADDAVLKRMNRRGDRKLLETVIDKIRSTLPDAVIRTTFMVGFPGESDKEFETLAGFVKKIRFDRMGCFAFSPEEGTPAFDMPNQIDEKIKAKRGEILMQSQLMITDEINSQKIGKVFEVIVDDFDEENNEYVGRTYMDAPEIDGIVRFTDSNVLKKGDFVKVEITDYSDYDLIGVRI